MVVRKLPKRTKKASVEKAPDNAGYKHFRLNQWAHQPDVGYDFRAATYPDGTTLAEDAYLLKPKPNMYYKDEWHCGSEMTARSLASAMVMFPDVNLLEYSGKVVYVKWDHHGVAWELPDKGAKT